MQEDKIFKVQWILLLKDYSYYCKYIEKEVEQCQRREKVVEKQEAKKEITIKFNVLNVAGLFLVARLKQLLAEHL
jgi:hypothetical protein